MSKTYRTAKGQLLDVGSLLLQNENTRAVGNMGVNARGDKINSDGAVIKGRNEQMQKQYSQVHKKVQKKTKDQRKRKKTKGTGSWPGRDARGNSKRSSRRRRVAGDAKDGTKEPRRVGRETLFLAFYSRALNALKSFARGSEARTT